MALDNNYYRNNTDLKSSTFVYTVYMDDIALKFKSDNGVFSKNGLDYATGLLLQNVVIEEGKTVLDAGCGIGPIGIYYAKKYHAIVTMIDINDRALELAKYNLSLNNVNGEVLKSDCLDDVKDKYDYIISNPPIRAGKSVIYKIYEQAKDHLKEGGKFYIIIQKHHGAPSTIAKLEEIYNHVKIIYKKKGFYIIEAKM